MKEAGRILEAIASAAKDAIIVADNNDRVVFWNKAAEVMFGYSSSEITGKSLHETLAPKRYHKDFRSKHPHFQRTGEGDAIGKTLELVGVKKDSTEFPLELSLSATMEDGKWISVGVIRDITDRKMIEMEVLRTKTLLNETGMLAKVGGWELDLATNEIYWTKEVYNIHELPEGDGHVLEEGLCFYDMPGRTVIEAAVKRCAEFGEPFDLKLPFTTARGSHIWVRSIGHAVRDEEKIVKLSGTFQDITEYVLVEGEMKEYVNNLERFQKVTMGREKRISELKEEIERLKVRLAKRGPEQ